MVNEAKSERFQHEEDEKVIAQMLEDGELTVEEAQKRIARGQSKGRGQGQGRCGGK